MKRPARILAGAAVFVYFLWAVGYAADHEAEASAQVSSTAAILLVFPASTEWAAVRVARCESRLYRYAVGRAGERGIFQIHPIHFSWADPGRLFDPVYNSRVAYRLSRGGRSWRHWTCKP